jgi:hypothetical protein
VKIDDLFPVVFIHFSAGIPRSWDPVLGTYMDRYLAALRRFSEDLWERELEKRNPERDIYLEQKSNLYLRIKRRVVSARLSWLPRPTKENIAILAQSGTSQQCLGLWLRQVQGTVLSSIPVINWSGDGIETLDEKIASYRPFNGSKRSLQNMLKSAMDGNSGDPVHINWANWSSMIRTKRMVMNFPEGSLCWPEMANSIGQHHQVIALVSHPLPFAKRMMAIFGDGRHLQCMTDTRAYLEQHPERTAGLEDMLPAEYAWVIKWCLDMSALEASTAAGRQIHIVKEEELMSDTSSTLIHLFKALGWQWSDEIPNHFRVFCQFHDRKPEHQPKYTINTGDPEIMGLDHLMRTFNIVKYTSDQHALKPDSPSDQMKKVH